MRKRSCNLANGTAWYVDLVDDIVGMVPALKCFWFFL